MGYMLWTGTQLDSENPYTGAPYQIKPDGILQIYIHLKLSPSPR